MPRMLPRTIVVGLAALIAGASAAQAQSGPLVRTKQGWLQSLTSGGVEQFRGVPHATAPLGDLPWRAPLPPQPYSGVRQATAFPALCIQARPTPGLPLPSEDCLYVKRRAPLRILGPSRVLSAPEAARGPGGQPWL
jgi:para-nitrobenzyl esterase